MRQGSSNEKGLRRGKLGALLVFLPFRQFSSPFSLREQGEQKFLKMERSGLAVLYCAAMEQRHILRVTFLIYMTIKFKADLRKSQKETTKLPQRCYSCSPSLSLLLGYVARADSKIVRSIYLVKLYFYLTPKVPLLQLSVQVQAGKCPQEPSLVQYLVY